MDHGKRKATSESIQSLTVRRRVAGALGAQLGKVWPHSSTANGSGDEQEATKASRGTRMPGTEEERQVKGETQRQAKTKESHRATEQTRDENKRPVKTRQATVQQRGEKA